jgi:hypothetical protein
MDVFKTLLLDTPDPLSSFLGILPSANGGTGTAYFGVSGPTTLRTYTFPNANATIARTDAAQTFTGTQTLSNALNYGGVLLNAAVTGTGNMVLSASPTFSGTVTSGGNIGLAGNGTGARYVALLGETNTYAGSFILQAGGGSAGFGGGLVMYGHSHASFPGWIKAGISTSSGGKFSVNTNGVGTGSDVFTVDSNGLVVAGGQIFVNGAGNGIITAGTGNSRTLALQSTTSGGVATTFLTGNADQSVSLAGPSITGTGAASFDFVAVRASTSAGATYQFKTGSTLDWFMGTRGLVNSNFYLFNNSTSTNSIIVDYATNAVSLAGTTEATTGGAGSLTTAGGIYATKAIISGSTTASTSTTTGSLINAGGFGNAGAAYIGGAMNLAGALTYGGVTLSNSVTGTGSMVLSAGPTLTGTITAAAANFSGANTIVTGTTGPGLTISTTNAGNLDATLRVQNLGTTANTAAGIEFITNNTTPATRTAAALYGQMTTTTAGAEIGQLIIATRHAGIASGSNAMVIGDTGIVTLNSTTASTSTTTGSLVNAGGFGNAGAAYIGGILNVAGATATFAGTVIHTLSATPASASATGTTGTISWDASYIYICTATNTWKRVAIATW